MTGINFTIPKNYKKIVTNPKDPNSFVIVKTDGLLFCEIKPKYVGIDENSTDKEYQIVSTYFSSHICIELIIVPKKANLTSRMTERRSRTSNTSISCTTLIAARE